MRWLALVVVLVGGSAQAVPCRVSEPAAVIMTPATATADDAGGLVAANPPKDGWELSQASTAKTLELRTIAPGLAVIPLPTNGAFELRDAKHAVLATVMRGPVQHKPLAAPKPKAVKLKRPASRGDDTTITATLGTKAPAGAVALIVFVKGKARSWGRVIAGASSVVVYQGACQVTPPIGSAASRVGESVNLAWLDETGHVSSPSAAVKIR